MKKRINNRVHRGRVEVWLTVEEGVKSLSRLSLSLETAREAHRHLLAIKDELGLDDPITLGHLLHFAVIVPDKAAGHLPLDNDLLLEGLLALSDKALDQLVAMRESEGEQLRLDLLARLEAMSESLDDIKKLSVSLPLAATKRYQARLEELAETILDPNRLSQEAAILAEKVDITEELIRFGSHIQGLRNLLQNSDEPVGRRIEFLLQEMGREINTIGSKSQAKTVIDLVLSLKSELEKIREQSMNIE